jgi:hypothetical protein
MSTEDFERAVLHPFLRSEGHKEAELLARIVREAFGVTVVGLAVGISGDRGWGISARAETGWG